MSLNDYHFEPDYNKAYDNIAEAFYLPCMRASKRYDRISGYFGSTIYIIAWEALKEFVNNNGKMRLICSPCLSDEDLNALKEGYSSKNNTLIEKAILKELDEMFASPFIEKTSRVLACLIAKGVVNVKIAIPGTNDNADIKRLFHDKVGIFCDKEGNCVGFRGPMNETYKGLSSDGNLESIDVFPSWEDERDQKRLDRVRYYFEQLWNKSVDSVCVYDIPEAAEKFLFEKSNGYNWEELVDEITVKISLADKWKADKSPLAKKPRQHQVTALENWLANDRRGILEHATGSGKTYTAICAIRNALESHETVLVLVPSAELLKQWKKELEDNIKDLEINYLVCGDGNNYWRNSGVLASWTQSSQAYNKVIISTMDTASSENFLSNICQGQHLFLVADEVHRLGSSKRRQFLTIQTGPRLGLSATPIRYGDPDGTAAIMEYFDGIIPPPFTLSDAIHSGVLTRYFYKPLKISLSADEQIRWDELTKEINTLIARNGNPEGDIKETFANPRIQMKLIARARIIKNASAKVNLALETIKAYYKRGQKWIIYCDNQVQLKGVLQLLLKSGYDAYEYHSEMAGDRDQTLLYFSSNGGILVSIRCLDEGVDIPSATHALILASSKNPREFIQRRGRILRKADGKHFAYLYDAIVIPNKGDDPDKSVSIIEAELARAIQFGEWAENPSCIADLKIIAFEHGIDLKNVINGGYEDGEE